MRFLTLALLLSLPCLAQDVAVDRAALAEFLAKKNLKPADFGFDFDHLASMPPEYVSSHASLKSSEGHLAVFRRIQKDPVTFPDEVQRISNRILKGEMFEAVLDAMDVKLPAAALHLPPEIAELPAELRKPVASILAAMDAKDPGEIWKSIVAARPALEGFKGAVTYAKDGVVLTSTATPTDPSARLTIRFGGDDTYKGPWAGAKAGEVRVLIDTGGNDTYEAGEDGPAQGGAQEGGIAFLVDFAGNDHYRSGKQPAQGAATGGTGVLWDAAGDDTYDAEVFAQGAGQQGIGILVDDAGNDSYTITNYGQGFAGAAGFGLLLDRAGDDTYKGRDPSFGDPVTSPAPQDPKHNANMIQGAGFGHNGEPFMAGGIGMLLDVKGDDVYKAGCWAQGVGYFNGVGACIDLAGNDSYEAWVYVMGSGAHGGAGIQIDARGDDVYKVSGWNGPAMSVDYGIGFFLDGAGNDQYLGPSSGLGTSIGLGISLFQDSGGDDLYQPKDDRVGFGIFYEKEDYNGNGTVEPAEKRHWGIFLDCGGSDRYPAGFGNARDWSKSDFAGGLDRPSKFPDLAPGKARGRDGKEVDVTEKNREDVEPADLLKLVKGDAAVKAAFALDHGLWREGSEWVSKAKEPKALLQKYFGPEERTYVKDLRFWATKEEMPWAEKIRALKPGAKADPAWPRWAQRLAAEKPPAK